MNIKTNYVRKLVYSFDFYDLETYNWKHKTWDQAEIGVHNSNILYSLKDLCEGPINYESYQVFELGQLKLPEWGSATTGFPAEVNKTFRSAFPEGQFTTVGGPVEELMEGLNGSTSQHN